MQHCWLMFVNTLASEFESESRPHIHPRLPFSLTIFAFFQCCVSKMIAADRVIVKSRPHLTSVGLHAHKRLHESVHLFLGKCIV